MSFDRIIFSTPCFNFLNGMLSQISRGLRGFDGKIEESLEAMSGEFAKACLRDDVPLAFAEPVKWKLPNRLLELQTAYLDWLGQDAPYVGSGKPLYPIMELLPEVTKKARKSGVEFRPLQAQEDMKGLELAIAMAEDNIGRTDDRLMALRFLDAILGRSSWASREAADEYSRAHTRLWQNRTRFFSNLMRLVLVSGDVERMEALRARIGREYLSSNMSVIEYLQPDGVVPGGWFDSDEQALRTDVANALSTQLVSGESD